MEDEGWKEIKKGKAIPRPTEKKNSGPLGKPQAKPKTKEAPNVGSSSGEKVDAIDTQEEPVDLSKKVKDAGAESIIPPADEDPGGK